MIQNIRAMKIIILGAGRRGVRLARHLVQEKKSVVIIDSSSERCQQVSSKLDCMAVCGSATDLSILIEAGAAEASAVIAVTDSDEVNLVACGIASSNFPQATTIAAIRSISYLGNHANKHNKRILGIDHIVNPEEEAAKRMTSVIKSGLFSEIISFDDADFVLFRVTVTSSTPFAGKSLIEMKKELQGEYIIIGIRRGKNILTPTGNTVLKSGDEIAIMAEEDDAEKVFHAFSAERKNIKLRRMIAVGGTRICRYLFSNLGKRMLKRMSLIEKDPAICQEFSDEFPEVLTINESITDETIWEDERLNQADLMISVTENDELNIITASYAKRIGTKKTMALLKTNPNYIQFSANMDIDVTVSTTEATVDAIMKYLRGESVVTLHSIFNGELEVYEYVLSDKFSLIGKALMDVNLKGKCIIAGVKRESDGSTFVPNGSYEFREGDTVLVACVHENYDSVTELFR